MTSTLTIFRGLPGSGKTTHARELAEKTGAMLIEPDSLTIKGGKYCYTPAAHAHVQGGFGGVIKVQIRKGQSNENKRLFEGAQCLFRGR